MQNLTYRPLISTRSLGSRWRVKVKFDATMVDEKQRMGIPNLLIPDHGHAEIVQHEPVSVEPRRHNGVVFFPDVVPQDNDPKVIGGNPGALQRNEFCDRVIFAIASAFGERRQRRTPDILHTVKPHIPHRLYGHIDPPLNLTYPPTAFPPSAPICHSHT